MTLTSDVTGPLFLSFEGIDGSGKSTQARRLAATLKDAGVPVTLTREPGGSPGAEEIRELVLTGDPGRWSAETEILLFTAARRDHLERLIDPSLNRGEIVITDRFADSTRLYQGVTRGDLREVVDRLHALMIGREPDVTLIFDMDPAKALARTQSPDRAGSEARFEDFGLSFQQKIRAGFLEIAQAQPDRCKLIDADGDADTVARRVLDALGWAP